MYLDCYVKTFKEQFQVETVPHLFTRETCQVGYTNGMLQPESLCNKTRTVIKSELQM